MPRPSKEWERKYGKQHMQEAAKTRLSGADTVYSAISKLAEPNQEAGGILMMMLRTKDENKQTFALLDMDDMKMYGNKIVEAYHNWAGNDYDKLFKGITSRDAGLIAFLKSVKE